MDIDSRSFSRRAAPPKGVESLGAEKHYPNWDGARWPHFHPAELACRHCGALVIWPSFLDKLESVRESLGQPIHILSGHRCALHNARVGGAPLSQHLGLAVDIALRGQDRLALRSACLAAGFSGFGYYQTFLHIDLGRRRHWFGSEIARAKWQTFLD